ncbi:MAG TPA: MBL fold metallo-hydrolase [Dehalococcoidia bacterium]|nr:MBL fold metallo-hydrolase [Dehalococcoidia bacterium]
MSEEPQVSELLVRGIVVGLFAENCWIVGNRRTGEAICIDPGDQPQDILNLAKDLGVRIKLIVNSHGHLDHVLGVRAIKEATGAKFLMHRADVDIARGASRAALMWLGRYVEPPPDPDAFIEDGDEVDVDGVKLKVIHTPGHTPGSCSFFTEGMLFSGDTLFRGSIGRTDLPGGDYDQEMRSIIDKLLVLPDDTVVLPGHMEETRIGIEKATNPFVLMELRRRQQG